MKLLRESLARKKRGEKGFSFIELIIVVAVVGILTSIAIPSYGAIQSNAKQAAVDSNAQTGYRLVAATLAGFEVAPASFTRTASVEAPKPGSPQAALFKLSNEDIALELLDKAGAPIGATAAVPEEFCVYAHDKKAGFLADGKTPKFFSLVGSCPATLPGTTTPTNPTNPSEPEPTPPPVVTPEPEPTPPAPTTVQPGETNNPKPTYSTNAPARVNFGAGAKNQIQRIAVANGVAYMYRVVGTNNTNNTIYEFRDTPRINRTYMNHSASLTSVAAAQGKIYAIEGTKISIKNAAGAVLETITLSNVINQVVNVTENGDIYFTKRANSADGLWVYEAATKTEHYFAPLQHRNYINLVVGQDALYYNTSDGLYKVDARTKATVRISKEVYSDIYFTADKKILGSQGANLFTIDPSTGERTLLITMRDQGQLKPIVTFTVDAVGGILFISDNQLHYAS